MSGYALALQTKGEEVSVADRSCVRCGHCFIERRFLDVAEAADWNECKDLRCALFVDAVTGEPLLANDARELHGPCGPDGVGFEASEKPVTERVGWGSVPGSESARGFQDWQTAMRDLRASRG